VKPTREQFRGVFAIVMIAAGAFMLMTDEGDAAVSPYTTIGMPANDGGIVIYRPPQFSPTPITSGETSQKNALIQAREGAAAPVRIGNARVRGKTENKNGVQLKARESVSWTVNASNTPYCVVEDSDAGVIVDVVFGIGGPL
jgi:hypothetical protein